MSECIFCKITNKEIPSDLLYEDDEIIALSDINPIAPVHILIISKKHIESVIELEKDDEKLVGKMVGIARDLAAKNELEGYKLMINVGSEGGQTVDHLHLHMFGGRVLEHGETTKENF